MFSFIATYNRFLAGITVLSFTLGDFHIQMEFPEVSLTLDTENMRLKLRGNQAYDRASN